SSTHNTCIEQLWVEVGSHDCKSFADVWNMHPLSGLEGKDESPHVSCLISGMIDHGVYTDDCNGLDLQTIEESYGTLGEPVQHPDNHTGAGFLVDEDVPMPSDQSDSDSESDNLTDTYDNEFLPKAVHTPCHTCPLTAKEVQVFEGALQAASKANIMSHGYGIRPEEWRETYYPIDETIRTERKGGKELVIQLPKFVWRPRAHLWTLGLSIMDRIIENRT
ncbi:hypothetical protein BDP27DRAFT_1228229, partial [Rhodocollybia butyracea]